MEDFYRRRGEISWVDSLPRTGSADGAIDWVEKGAVTPATSQGRCATCQDFSAIADVESAWHLSGGHPLTKQASKCCLRRAALCSAATQVGLERVL